MQLSRDSDLSIQADRWPARRSPVQESAQLTWHGTSNKERRNTDPQKTQRASRSSTLARATDSRIRMALATTVPRSFTGWQAEENSTLTWRFCFMLELLWPVCLRQRAFFPWMRSKTVPCFPNRESECLCPFLFNYWSVLRCAWSSTRQASMRPRSSSSTITPACAFSYARRT